MYFYLSRQDCRALNLNEEKRNRKNRQHFAITRVVTEMTIWENGAMCAQLVGRMRFSNDFVYYRFRRGIVKTRVKRGQSNLQLSGHRTYNMCVCVCVCCFIVVTPSIIIVQKTIFITRYVIRTRTRTQARDETRHLRTKDFRLYFIVLHEPFRRV